MLWIRSSIHFSCRYGHLQSIHFGVTFLNLVLVNIIVLSTSILINAIACALFNSLRIFLVVNAVFVADGCLPFTPEIVTGTQA